MNPVPTVDQDVALTYGVWALKDAYSGPGSNRDLKRQKKCGHFVVEPLLVAALLEEVENDFEEEELNGHSEVGYLFEEYLALKVDLFGDCVVRGVKRFLGK